MNQPTYMNHLSEFNVIKDEFLNMKNKSTSGFAKYFDMRREWSGKYKWIELLGLNKTTGLDILDLCSGIFIFGWICKQLGHNVLVSDKHTSNKEFNIIRTKLLKLFDLNYRDIRISLNTPMDIQEKFDVVTLFGTSFQSNWSIPQFVFFLDDLDKLLKDDSSKVLIQPNRSGVLLFLKIIDENIPTKLKIQSINYKYHYFILTRV